MLQRATLYINHWEHYYLSSCYRFLEVELPGQRVENILRLLIKIWQIAYSKFLPIYILQAVEFSIFLKPGQHYFHLKYFPLNLVLLKWSQCLSTYLSKLILIYNYLLTTLFSFFSPILLLRYYFALKSLIWIPSRKKLCISLSFTLKCSVE